jgi:hypothetical protein
MRKIAFIIIVVVTLISFSSCNSCSNKQHDPSFEEMVTQAPEMPISKNDTIEVRALATQFLENLRNHRYDQALSMLYYLNGDKIVSLPSKLAVEQMKVFRAFPVYSYTIDNLIFFRETDNQLRYTVIFQLNKKGDFNHRPKQIKGVLRPVRYKGKWYLTAADTKSETGHGSEIRY